MHGDSGAWGRSLDATLERLELFRSAASGGFSATQGRTGFTFRTTAILRFCLSLWLEYDPDPPGAVRLIL